MMRGGRGEFSFLYFLYLIEFQVQFFLCAGGVYFSNWYLMMGGGGCGGMKNCTSNSNFSYILSSIFRINFKKMLPIYIFLGGGGGFFQSWIKIWMKYEKIILQETIHPCMFIVCLHVCNSNCMSYYRKLQNILFYPF